MWFNYNLKDNTNLILIGCFAIPMMFGMPLNNGASEKLDFEVDTSGKDVLIHNIEKQLSDAGKAKITSLASSLRNFGREHAATEVEHKLSQFDSSYANLHKKTNEFVNAKPIVDTISEHEKYGNTGGQTRAVSTAVVGVYENIANAINAFFEVPAEAMKNFKKAASEALRYAGVKLVGL